MALKNLTVRLQSRVTDTPDTLKKIFGYQRKAPIHAGCTPDTTDTSCFSDTPAILQIGPFAQAVKDPSPPPEPPADPNAWRELAQAYHAHHFGCSTCKAAGRGAVYSLRCGTGAALWHGCRAVARVPRCGLTTKTLDAQLPADLAVQLQRCDGLTAHPTSTLQGAENEYDRY